MSVAVAKPAVELAVYETWYASPMKWGTEYLPLDHTTGMECSEADFVDLTQAPGVGVEGARAL